MCWPSSLIGEIAVELPNRSQIKLQVDKGCVLPPSYFLVLRMDSSATQLQPSVSKACARCHARKVKASTRHDGELAIATNAAPSAIFRYPNVPRAKGIMSLVTLQNM